MEFVVWIVGQTSVLPTGMTESHHDYLAGPPRGTNARGRQLILFLMGGDGKPNRRQSRPLTRGPAHFDWRLAGATRSGTAGGEACSRSKNNDTPPPPMASLICRNTKRKK